MWSQSSEKQEQQLGNKVATEVNANNHKENCANSDKCENEEQKYRGTNKEDTILKFGVGKEVEGEAADSGFISGVNLSSNLEFEADEVDEDTEPKQKLNKSVNEGKQQKLEEQEFKTLDSGCIEAEEEEEENFETDVANSINPGSSTETDGYTKRHSEAQVKNEMNSKKVGGEAADSKSRINASTGINNFNLTQRATTAARQKPRIVSWEEFYQQNSDGDTPLHLACLAGAEDVVIALLRLAIHPCLYNIQNDDAQTPLHMAALCSQTKILRLLLIMGAEPNIRDRHGNTALHLAIESGYEQCVRALLTPISSAEMQEGLRICAPKFNEKMLQRTLKAGRLDLDIRNYNGEKCVHLAAQEGRINILRMLIESGADINAREGKSGRTPLHIAIECCNEALVNFLLEECQNDLNLETETYAGLTAYQFACLLDKNQLTNVLAKFGAEPLTPPVSDYENSDGEDLDDSKVSLNV